MSRARRHGLMRLAVLIGLVGWLVVLAVKGTFSSGSQTGSRSAAVAMRPPARLKATPSSMRLPQPLHGATAASSSSGLLVIGGADRNDISTNQVLRLDPGASRGKSAGTLGAPLHDAAAASLGSRTLVFGGGASSTLDTVQELVSGGTARQVGHLPIAASDVSAVSDGAAAYV